MSELQEALAGREQEVAELEAELAALRRSGAGDDVAPEQPAVGWDGAAGELHEELHRLRERADAAEAALAAAQAAAAEASQQAAAAQEQAEQLQASLRELERSREAALQQAEAAEAVAKAGAAASTQEAESRLHEAQQLAAAQQEQLEALQQQLAEAQEAAAAQQARADELAAALAAVQQELQQLQQQRGEEQAQGALSVQPSETFTEAASAPGSPTAAAAAAAAAGVADGAAGALAGDSAALQAECARLTKELQVRGAVYSLEPSARRTCGAVAVATSTCSCHIARCPTPYSRPACPAHSTTPQYPCRTPSASLCWWPRRSSTSTPPSGCLPFVHDPAALRHGLW